MEKFPPENDFNSSRRATGDVGDSSPMQPAWDGASATLNCPSNCRLLLAQANETLNSLGHKEVELSVEELADDDYDRDRVAELLARVYIANSQEVEKLTSSERRSVRDNMASAIHLALAGYYDAAFKLLNATEHSIGEATMARRWEELERQDRRNLLILQGHSFLVWVDDELEVDWETNTFCLGNSGNHFEEVLNRAAMVESIPFEHLNKKHQKSFKRLVGEGIARGLANQHRSAFTALDSAENYVRSRNQETSRMWYLTGSALLTVLFGLVALITWSYQTNAIEFKSGPLSRLFFACGAGALGAQLSIMIRMHKLDLDPEAGRWAHYWEACSRVIAGFLFGGLAALVTQLDIIKLNFHKSDMSTAILLISALAGLSERFASSIISQVQPRE